MVMRIPTKESALALAVIAGFATAAQAQQKSRAERIKSQEVYWNSADEPPSMDISKQVDTVSAMWLGHIYEGLLTYDQKGNLVPATAESYTISPDKKTWTFKIRKNAKWQDGKPVSAKDFVYSWQRLVDPAFASEYSFSAAAANIANAADIVAKKKPKSALGVKAVDDHTLVVTLDRPTAYFDSMMAFQTFFPLRKDIVEKFGPNYATSAASIVGNGPFKLVAWQREHSMRLERADTYWNKAKIHLKAIETPAIIKDAQASFNNYQTGGIDLVGTNTPELIKQAQSAHLKIQSFPQGCVDFFELNTRPGRPFANKELRLAVQQGINRHEFANKIVGVPGYKPVYGLVPDYMPGDKPGRTYRSEAPLSWKDANVAQAEKDVKAAKETGKVTFTILSDDSSLAKKYAEYWQNSLSKLLNAHVLVETVPFKTRLQKSRDGQFDLSLAGWCPDYRDAMTFMDLYTSHNDNNTSGWANKTYDDLIEKAKNEPDLTKRVEVFKEAEKILASEAPIVPTTMTATAYVVAPGLKGVHRAPFGVDPDFRYAEWDAKAAH